jgi:protein arginine N-methyltransferase 1
MRRETRAIEQVNIYNLAAYGHMMADQVRMAAYTQALRQSVKPGCLVLDIGTGAGIFALLACRFGARRVIAIEPSDTIQVARQLAAANGYADRIVFIQDYSTRVTLSERADVIISDLRGVLPLFQQHIPSIIDARQRFLAPGGILIPQRDTVWATVVQAPELYQHLVGPWEMNNDELDLHAACQMVTNTWNRERVQPAQRLTAPQSWAVLDYTTIESADVHAQLLWEASRAGIVHGLSVWFEATLMDGVTFSTASTDHQLVYGTAFFPWSKPVSLEVDDVVSTLLCADLVGDDYVWRWNTCVRAGGQAGPVNASFKQSTFFGTPRSLLRLHKQASDYVPRLSEKGRIDGFILTLMDRQRSLGDIARQVAATFPEWFFTWQDALTRVTELSQMYSCSS